MKRLTRSVAAAAAGLLFLAPVAHADPAADDAFIAMLENAGYTGGDRAVAIENGHLVCEHLWAGDATVDDITAQIDEVEPYFGPADARAFVSIAIQAFCPNIGARYKTIRS